MRYLLLFVLFLQGCAAYGSPASAYKEMTAEQIKAVTSDKSSSIVCIHGRYATATITSLGVNADKGIPANITVDAQCGVSIGQRIKDSTAE